MRYKHITDGTEISQHTYDMLTVLEQRNYKQIEDDSLIGTITDVGMGAVIGGLFNINDGDSSTTDSGDFGGFGGGSFGGGGAEGEW